jgi:lipopolysaccharide biosynthesis glycosyltransferase
MFNSHNNISVALASDDAYAMSMAVTVRSLLSAMKSDRQIDLYILDVGISDDSRNKLKTSCLDPRLTVHWLKPEIDQFDNLPVMNHLNRSAYARLLTQDLLPSTLDKVIYLDSDLLVLEDISVLWDDCVLRDNACLAVQDIGAPWIDSEKVLNNLESSRNYLAAVRPIGNYQELGLPPDAPYFNSGVMVINLAFWREFNVAGRVIECLKSHSEHVLWLDQYALNVVLHGRWQQLDLRWNQGSQIFVYPCWQDSPLNQEDFYSLKYKPYIVHFTSVNKPWQIDNRHPYRKIFFRTLDRTAWAGWRPGSIIDRIYTTIVLNWKCLNKVLCG